MRGTAGNRRRSFSQGERFCEVTDMEVTDVEDMFLVRRVGSVCSHVRGKSFSGQLGVLSKSFLVPGP